MPNLETANGPIAEMLDLRLMRNTLAQIKHPAGCRKRQCRRTGYCMGRAILVGKSILQANRLPPCIREVNAEFLHTHQALSTEIMDFIRQSEARRPWPEDPDMAERLRHRMAVLQRVHDRPGLHLDRERDALTLWRARDPDPRGFALWRRAVRHAKQSPSQAGASGPA